MRIIHLVRTQNFRKTNISYPLIRTRKRAYRRERNNSFLENSIRIILKACLQILILRKIKYKFVLAVSFVEIEERKGKNKRLQNMFSESIRRVHLL